MKTIYTIIIVLACTVGFSQQNQLQESEIIISRENLILLLQKFKAKQQNRELAQNELKSASENDTKSGKTDSIHNKITQLEKEIKVLTIKIDSMPKSIIFKDTTFMAKEKISHSKKSKIDSVKHYVTKVDTVYQFRNNQTEYKEISKTISDKNYDSELAELNRKYESLYNQMLSLNSTNINPEAKPAKKRVRVRGKENITQVENASPKKEMLLQENPKEVSNTVEPTKAVVTRTVVTTPIVISEDSIRSNVVQKMPTVEEKQAEKSTYEVLFEKFGSVKKKVFFDNNSSEIEKDDLAIIFDIMTIINNNPTVDVFLEGFSSQKGNPAYNEKLSLKRTESVKQYLISKGIHPTRISSNYLGIDYQAPNEAAARRVDVSFMIRR